MFNRLGKLPRPSLTKLVGFSVFGLLTFCLYFYHLGKLTKGLSPTEVSARTASSSIHNILFDPVYAPHKVLQYASTHLFGHGAFALRCVSVVIAILFVFCFYQILKGWFGKLIAFFGALFFASTPWFILLARGGGPEIMLLTSVVVLASYYLLLKSPSVLAWSALFISGLIVIYLPGGLFLILLGLVLARNGLKKRVADLDLRQKLLGTVIALTILAPLIYGCILNTSAIKPLLLIPADWPPVLVGLKSLAWDTLALFWRTPVHGDFIIGRLPMANGAQAVLAAFGIFALYKLARSKLYLVLGLVVFAILAAAINRNLILLSLALPAISLVVAAGLRYLYMEWRSIFPKNPLPKYLALALIASLTAIHIFYGLHYVLDAWSNTPETRTTYNLK